MPTLKALVLREDGTMGHLPDGYTLAEAGGGGASYAVYTALLTQSGTDAPVATVLENTLGGAVAWSRYGAGVYRITKTGAFLAGKVSMSDGVIPFPGAGSALPYTIRRVDDDNIELTLYDPSVTPWADDNVLSNFLFEIRVYP